MERQAGASYVDLDTVDQWAKVYYRGPTVLDFPNLVRAADSAAFPTIDIEVEVAGVVRRNHCEDCGEDRDFLLIEETGQSLELREFVLTEGSQVRIKAVVQGWEGGPIHLTPLSGESP